MKNDKQLLREALVALLEKVGPENMVASSESLRRKIEKGLIYPSISNDAFKQIQSEVLGESVFDPINKTRSREIFDENDTMRPEVKSQIMVTIEEWKNKLGIEFDIKKMIMIGSMTGFQYNNTADIDINVTTTLTPEQANEARRMLPNGNNVEGTSHPINFWLADSEYVYDERRAENIYNIITDTWEKKSDAKDIKVPYAYVMELAKFFMDGFDLAISETERDIMEIDIYMGYSTEKQELSEKEKRDFISKKVTELKSDIDRLKIGKHILRSFMVEGYEEMPFKVSINYQNEDPRYSMNSMVYKAIDRLSYHDEKIPNAIKKASETIDKAEAYLSTEVEEDGQA